MKTLIISEKPDVAMKIKKAINESFIKNDGYFESENYIVTFAFGHLFQAWSIEDYLGKEPKSFWKLEDIPYIPNQFKIKLIEDNGIKKQYKIIDKLINRDDVNIILNNGDSDREGQVIIDEIIHESLKDKTKTIKRLWLPEQTEEFIRNAIKDAPMNSNYTNLYNEGQLRAIQDNLIGIQLTRYTTLLANKKLPVGRVLSAIVKAIYDRDMEIKNFVSQNFYTIKGTSEDKSISYTVLKTDKNLSLDEQKIEADNLIKTLWKQANVINVEEKEIIKKPSKLFSLDKIQNKLSKENKIKPTKTLTILQGLYLNGFVTYPRTNTEYLGNNEKDKINKILDKLKEDHNVTLNESKAIFDSSKVESHSALTITTKFPKEDELSEEEELVYNTILKRFISNFLVDKTLITETIISLEIAEGLIIKLKGKSVKQQGYLKYENDVKDKMIPHFNIGDKVDVCYSLEVSETKPKEHMTTEDLNNFLKNPFKKESDTDEDEYKAILEGLEIGTVSTRGMIIDNSIKYGYVEFKNDKYTITPLGIQYIEMLNKLGINLYKERTVEFSKMLKKVFNGNATIDEGVNQIKELLDRYIKKDVQIEHIKTEKEIIGKCPRCGNHIYESEKNFYCEGYKNNPKCTFVIWKNDKFFTDRGKKLTKSIVIKILKDKMVAIKGFKKKDGKGEYNAKVEIIDKEYKGQVYANFNIVEFIK